MDERLFDDGRSLTLPAHRISAKMNEYLKYYFFNRFFFSYPFHLSSLQFYAIIVPHKKF